MPISHDREQKIKSARGKVKYILNVAFLHMTNATRGASSLSIKRIINPACAWAGCDLAGHGLPSSAYNNSPRRALSTPRKSRAREKPLSLIFVTSAQDEVCDWLCRLDRLLCMTYNQIKWPSLGLYRAINHRWVMEEYVFSFSINHGYPSSKSQLSHAQQMARQ